MKIAGARAEKKRLATRSTLSMLGGAPRAHECVQVLVLYRKREGTRGIPLHGVFARFRYNDLKGARLRRTRALCKFKWCEGAAPNCAEAVPQSATRDCMSRKLAAAKKDREVRGQEVGKADSFRGKTQRYGAGRNTFSNWRTSLHAAAVSTGGERSWISAAVSLSTTVIGPPHLGQDQRSLGRAVEAACSVCSSGRILGTAQSKISYGFG
jgi:hypothetical protein